MQKSYKSVKQERPRSVSNKSVKQIVLPERCPAMSSKGVLQECHFSLSSQGVPQVGSLENVINVLSLFLNIRVGIRVRGPHFALHFFTKTILFLLAIGHYLFYWYAIQQPSQTSTGSLGSTSVGLTPPPGLFVPSGFATPLTPAAPLVPAPLAVMPQCLGLRGWLGEGWSKQNW